MIMSTTLSGSERRSPIPLSFKRSTAWSTAASVAVSADTTAGAVHVSAPARIHALNFLFSFLLPPFCLKPCSGKPLLFSCNYIRNTLCPVAGSLAKCLPNDLWKYHLFSDICYYITLSNLRCNMFMNIFPSFRSDLSFINLSIFVHYFFIILNMKLSYFTVYTIHIKIIQPTLFYNFLFICWIPVKVFNSPSF